MESILLAPLIVGFLIVVIFMPLWIKKMKVLGLVWEDMNKSKRPKDIAGSGGTIVVFGFVLGVLSYIFIKTFLFGGNGEVVEIFSLLTTVLIASIVGFIDDMFGWVRGGLSWRLRIVLILFAAIPLIVINAGTSVVYGIEFGLWYPLLIIPIGIIGATTTFNFLAGYNGLESSQGIIILLALAFVNWSLGNNWLSLINLIMVICLFGFWLFNKYPAKVFPGDILTYSVGALIAVTAILGNVEKIAIFFFVPYILETILKVRGGLKKQSFGKVNEDGSLDVPYEKFYGLEHISIYLIKKIKRNGKAYEKEVVYLINLFQITVIVLGLVLFPLN